MKTKQLLGFVLVVLLFTTNLSANRQQDSLALVALFNATDGPNWSNYTNWLTSQPIEKWFGVTTTVNDIGRVYSLRIPNNNLRGSIPSSIGDLTDITYIEIGGNHLRGLIPKELGNCVKLTNLYLNLTDLTGKIPSELGKLVNLVDLCLHDNKLYGFSGGLSGDIPAELGNLVKLRQLRLDANYLTGSIPKEFGNLIDCQQLLLGNNKLTGNVPDEIKNLKKLMHLTIDNNNLTSFPDLSFLTTLQYLEIQKNILEFDDIEPNIGISSGWFKYSPQDSVGKEEKISICSGSSYTFDIQVGGANNRYQWFKDDLPITSITSNSSYTIPSISSSNSGRYNCHITNTIATELTLYNRLIFLSISDRSQDSLALVALYNSTNGTNWTNHTNWLTNQPIDTWFGVTVENCRVTKISLYENNLIGNIPTEISNLKELKVLELHRNKLSGGIPSQILSLSNLRELNLGANTALGGTIPTDIDSLTNLELISLGSCSLSGSIPTQICNLKKLQHLDLGYNDLIGGIPYEIGNLDSLKILNLMMNDKLGGTIPKTIGNLKKLTGLQLRRTNLGGQIPPEIGDLVSLEGLNLGDNSFVDSLPKEIGNLKNLTTLHIYWCLGITGSIPKEIGNLKNLTDLWLSAIGLTGSIPKEIGNLTKLVSLIISGSSVNSSIPSEIGKLNNLKTIDLSSNKLSGNIPIELSKLPNLSEMSLQDNKLDDSLLIGTQPYKELKIMDLSNNLLQNIPNLTPLDSLKILSLKNNKLEFDDIEPNLNVASQIFTYAPQDSVGIVRTDSICNGTTYTLDIQVGGSNNRYQWFKDDIAITNIDTNSFYVIPVFSLSDVGSYNCHITNTLAKDLTLYSIPINLVSALPPIAPVISKIGSSLESTGKIKNQWYYEGTKIPGAVGNPYKPEHSGNYQASYINENGCESSLSNIIYSALSDTIEAIERDWGTYYGGSEDDACIDIACDSTGNIYILGVTYSDNGISTSGSYQPARASSDSCDAFLIKLNSRGERIWGTYFGGTGNDHGISIAIDKNGDIIISGMTYSNNGIASSGAHQTKFNGYIIPSVLRQYSDAFIAKFDSNGNKLWSTYYGGSFDEYIAGISTDFAGNILVTGRTIGDQPDTDHEIATPNAFKTFGEGTREAYIVKFNPDGKRIWGTYYGGDDGWDVGHGIVSDKNGNVYVAGHTDSDNNNNSIATDGAYHSDNKYPYSAFLVKLDSNGNRLWGSYYPGYCYDLAIDNLGNLYLTGLIWSDTSCVAAISTPNSYQPEYGGYIDAYIMKLDNNGFRQWSSFYGGRGEEDGYGITVDKEGDILMTGWAFNTQDIFNSTCFSDQTPKTSNNYDAFAVKFKPDGSKSWGIYYGGNDWELGTINDTLGWSRNGIISDKSGNVYLCGYTRSIDNISTSNSHQQIKDLKCDGFIAKFNNKIIYPPKILSQGKKEYCFGDSLLLEVDKVFSSYKWLENGAELSGGNNKQYIINKNKPPGNYFYNVVTENSPCEMISDTIFVSIFPLPKPIITGNDTICDNQTTIYTSNQDSNLVYSWFVQGGSIIGSTDSSKINVNWDSPGIGIIRIVQTNSNGCIDSAEKSVLIKPKPSKPSITQSVDTLFSSSVTGNQWYLENNIIPGANIQKYVPLIAGNYTVAITDPGGCTSPYSDIYNFKFSNNSSATLQVGKGEIIEGEPGDIIEVPIILSQSQNLNLSGITQFKADLQFKSTVLEPYASTPQGSIVNNERIVPLVISVNPDNEKILERFKFRVTLGDDSTTYLKLNNLTSLGGQAVMKDIAGEFRMRGICWEGGARLISTSGKITLMDVRPNPVSENCEIEFEIIETGRTQLYLISSLGQNIRTIFDGEITKGHRTIDLDLTDISVGTYFLIMQTPTQRRIIRLAVVK